MSFVFMSMNKIFTYLLIIIYYYQHIRHYDKVYTVRRLISISGDKSERTTIHV
jgi:hypothetical protein